jgi:hypothetical protein
MWSNAPSVRGNIDQGLAPKIAPKAPTPKLEPASITTASRTIFNWAHAHDPDHLLPLELPGHPRSVVAATRQIGLNAELGAIAAGFGAGYQMKPIDLLLFNVAATQAAIAVQNAKLLHIFKSKRATCKRNCGSFAAHQRRPGAIRLHSQPRSEGPSAHDDSFFGIALAAER